MGPEYATGTSFETILPFDFLHCLENLNMLQSDKAFSQRPQNIFQLFTSVDTASSGFYKNLLKIYDSPKNCYLKKVFLP